MFEKEYHANWMIEQLNQKGFEAYYVGGCVRDALLGVDYQDIDLTTSATVDQMLELFKMQKVLQHGASFGSLSVVFENQVVEITTFRYDQSSDDHRHPSQIKPAHSLEEDCQRRDFTINAIAYHPLKGVIDPVGGVEDLKLKRLRCVGHPERRFHEDALRILRALKFSLRYNFEIETETKQAMHQCVYLLDYLSKPRIIGELKEILCAERIESAFVEFQDIFVCVIEELKPAINFQQGNPYHCYDLFTHTIKVMQAVEPLLELRLAALFHDLGKYDTRTVDSDHVSHFFHHEHSSAIHFQHFASRYTLDRQLTKRVLTMIKVHDLSIEPTFDSCWEWLFDYGEDMMAKIINLKWADNLAKSQKANERLAKIEECQRLICDMIKRKIIYQISDLNFNGQDLIELGFAGDAIGKTLKQLTKEVALAGLRNEHNDLRQRASELKGI